MDSTALLQDLKNKQNKVEGQIKKLKGEIQGEQLMNKKQAIKLVREAQQG